MGWDRHKLLWDGIDKYVPWTTLIIAQSHFVVANCADALMSVFYSPVLARSLIFLQL